MIPKRLFIPVVIIPLIIITGTFGFSYLDQLNLIDSFYLTVITICTVGYGDIVPLSPTSKLFAAILSIFGISAFLTTVPIVIVSLIEKSIRKVGNMQLKIKNHIIICGYNPIAKKVLENLKDTKEKVVVITSESSAIDKLQEENIPSILGDPTEESTLEKANISFAKSIIAVMTEDSENLLITLTARSLNKEIKIVSKVAQEKNISKLRKSGSNDVFSPETLVGNMIADSARKKE